MPRLPPVAMSPQTRLRARFCPGKTCSVATFFQSHSSSSATSCARPVSVPCPISERAMRITQVLSGLTTTQALTSVAAAVAASADAMNGSLNPSARPPPAAAEPTMNLRRERFVARVVFFMVAPLGLLDHVGGHVHASADALVGAAAADVGHRGVDIGVARLGILLEQRSGRHDLPGLAVAALRHVERRPGFLHRMRTGRGEPLDGHDPVAGLDFADRNGAGAPHLAVDVHGTGAALRDAAAVLRAGQAGLFADDPKERRSGLRLHLAYLAVDVEFCHERSPLTRCRKSYRRAATSARFRG